MRHRGAQAMGLVLALSLTAAACGSDDEPTVERSEVCDGSESLRLARLAQGGNIAWGEDVLWEVSGHSLLIDGWCRYWVREHRFYETRTGELDDEQFAALAKALHLGRWKELSQGGRGGSGEYCVSASDYGGVDYWLPDAHVVVRSCSPETPVSFDLEEPVLEAINELHANTEGAASGAVRYSLVESLDLVTTAWADAPAWPLGDPADVAVLSQTGARPPIHVAEGDDAEALRDLRRRVLDREFGDHFADGRGPSHTYVPIKQADGTRYELYLRDVGPFEDDDGHIDLDAQ